MLTIHAGNVGHNDYVEFTFKQFTFTAKVRNGGKIFYRESAHLGGQWSDAAKSLKNKSLHVEFRRALQQAVNALS